MPVAIAALIVGLALYPVQSPKPRRTAESGSAHVGDKANPANSSAEKENPAPNAAPPRSSAQTEDNQHDASEGNEGVQIQRQLEIATWVLVAIGIATAGFICWQAWETRNTAEAAKRGVELQKIAMQQWVDATEWHIDQSYTPPHLVETVIWIDFHIENPTKFKLTLESVELWLDRDLIAVIGYGKMFLGPDDYAIVRKDYKLTGQKLILFRDSVLRCEIGARITFIDAFGDKQERLVGVHCACRHRGQDEFEPIDFHPPDAEELEAQKRRKAQIQKQNPN